MDEAQIFFNQNPGMLPLYQAIESAICTMYTDVHIRVKKTQISFSNKHLFACVSLPLRKRKDWPKDCLVFTLGLNRRLNHPRVIYAVEPYRGRWTHHILLQTIAEVDAELMEWIKEAYEFAASKKHLRGKI